MNKITFLLSTNLDSKQFVETKSRYLLGQIKKATLKCQVCKKSLVCINSGLVMSSEGGG